MADVTNATDVNDKNFWMDFFKQESDGDVDRTDYTTIVSINDEINSQRTGISDRDRAESLLHKLYGELDPQEILAFLNIDTTQFEHIRLGFIQVPSTRVEELQNRLRAYQAKKSAELQALEARDPAASIAHTATRVGGGFRITRSLPEASIDDVPPRNDINNNIMSKIEDFILDNIMKVEDAPRVLELEAVGTLEFIPNLGLSVTTPERKVLCPVPSNYVVEVDGKKVFLGKIYSLLLASRVRISPYSGEHYVPRNLSEDEVEIFKQTRELQHRSEPDTKFEISFFPGSKKIGAINYSTEGFTIGDVNIPHDGPTITVVSKNGDVYKLQSGDYGCIHLSKGDVIQFGSNEPIYLSDQIPVYAGWRIEIPAPNDVIEQQLKHVYNPANGEVKVVVSARHDIHTYDEHGRSYKITTEWLNRIVSNRDKLNRRLTDKDNRKKLKTLGLEPEDLLGKTPQEMKKNLEAAFVAAVEAFAKRHGPIWERIFYAFIPIPGRATKMLFANKELSDLINTCILPVENFVNKRTQIQTPDKRPAKSFHATRPTTPETPAAPARTSNSLIGLMMGLKIMFASSDMENVANAVTLPQHSIELSAAATHEVDDSRDSHDSNARRVSERPAAIARSRALAARARAARAVIRG